MTQVTNDSKDGLTASGIAASATIDFVLLGGRYFVAVDDSGTAAGTLNVLMPDGQYLAIGTSTTFAAAGTAVVDLPAGSYQWAAGSGITLGSLVVQKVPYRPN
jgi:hypothetical protein